jgi:hypothetical protein
VVVAREVAAGRLHQEVVHGLVDARAALDERVLDRRQRRTIRTSRPVSSRPRAGPSPRSSHRDGVPFGSVQVTAIPARRRMPDDEEGDRLRADDDPAGRRWRARSSGAPRRRVGARLARTMRPLPGQRVGGPQDAARGADRSSRAMERGSRRMWARGDGWSRRSTVSRVGAGLKARAA